MFLLSVVLYNPDGLGCRIDGVAVSIRPKCGIDRYFDFSSGGYALVIYHGNGQVFCSFIRKTKHKGNQFIWKIAVRVIV